MVLALRSARITARSSLFPASYQRDILVHNDGAAQQQNLLFSISVDLYISLLIYQDLAIQKDKLIYVYGTYIKLLLLLSYCFGVCLLLIKWHVLEWVVRAYLG